MSSKKEPQYVGMGLSLGAGLGIVFSLLADWNLGLGIALGASLGLTVGAILDTRK